MLHVLPVPSRVGTLTKKNSNPGLYTASPWLAGAPDGGGKELVGITCYFHGATSSRGNTPPLVKRKQFGLLMHRRKHEISPLLPQAGRV